MKNLPIDWDGVPDVMNKDQFYRLCHISKSTALHLPKSGKVPCRWTGKKTRCYQIKKEDVLRQMQEYYAELLKNHKDVMTVREVVALAGYARSTVNNWCSRGLLKSFRKGNLFYIPKVFLIDFLCSVYFRTIVRKSRRHIYMLNDFSVREQIRRHGKTGGAE